MGLFAQLSPLDNWLLVSLDQPTQMVMGQFPVEVNENVSSEYAQFKALNRENPVIQFLSGNADTLSFQARFFARDMVFSGVNESITQLKKWSVRDSKLQRPHILSFRVGDGYVSVGSCVITGLSPIVWKKPTMLGAVKDATVTINLLKYKEFSMEDSGSYETRYHRTRFQDYYEFVCWNEYGNPNFGDVIRKRHPKKPITKPGDVVKLPSVEAIQTKRLEPTSLVLKTAYKRKETPQRTARINIFDRNNKTYVSHVAVE